MSYVECINVDYKSTRKESFYGMAVYLLLLLLFLIQAFPLKRLLVHVDFLILLCIYMPDLQLDVKGCRDVYASFDKYVEVERLEGDNKYHAEQHGLQVCFSVCFLMLC